MTDRKKVKELEEEIKRLKEENRKLEREYYEAQEQEIYKTAQCYCFRDKLLFYRAIPLSMITTPFYYNREVLSKKATACFMPKALKNIKRNADFAFDFNPQLHFAMLCERIIISAKGIMFVLSDPYRTIQTVPVESFTEEEAERYVGKIVIAKLIIPKDYEKESLFTLKAIKTTNYASEFRMVHEDWNILKKYTTVTGKTECMDAIKNIEKELYYKYPNNPENYMKSYGAWIHENEFRISTDNRLMCFCIKNGILWYADELRAPGPLGPYNIATEYAIYNSMKGPFGDSNKNIPLLLSGEENFDFFVEE